MTAIGMCSTLATAEALPGMDLEADRLVTALLPELRKPGNTIPFHGYYFHILSSTAGGFSAVAYPIAYRSSGVKTFIVTPDGAVSEKDLGSDTAKIAAALTTSRLDSTWTPAEAKP